VTDEPTNTTETETSTSPTTDGDSDAGTSGSSTDSGSDSGGETSILGSATTDAGTGDDQGDGAPGKDDGGTDESAVAVPEKYEISLTVKDAEGKDEAVEIDPVLLEAATPVLKDLGLTNEQANKVAGLVPQVQQRVLQQQQDEFAAQKAEWAKDAAEDKEIGGKNWKETQSLAARALDHFGATQDSEFRQLLDQTGLGNHPVMIGMFRKIGAALSEESTFAEGSGQVGKKDRLEELYPEDVKPR
jgi:hypothetical protein